MNEEPIKHFYDFEIGSSTNTGRISCALQGTDMEIQEQLNHCLQIYSQLLKQHMNREIVKKG